MKKMSLLFVMLLVLLSGIVFCGCGNKYKKLNIRLSNIEYATETYYTEANEISLVLDNEKLSICRVTFELSGVKEWGSINITSKPAEVVKVEEYEIVGNKCFVYVRALQPVEGGELIITHAGSGKNCKVPLNIGMQLQKMSTNNNVFVLKPPTFNDDEKNKTFEIPTRDLLVCEPTNYTDLIVWKQIDTENPIAGINVVSYDRDGKQTSTKNLGSAIRSVISIDKQYDSSSTYNAITLVPVSVLDGSPTEHNVRVTLYITDLLDKEEVAVISETHGDENGLLQDENKLPHTLALISNPDKDNPRTLEGYDGYDLYSTAMIEFKTENPDKSQGASKYISLHSRNSLFETLYQVNATSDIEGLSLEYVGFGKIRAIATSTCYGTGKINVEFSPKNSVGDIESFSIELPCVVGERATSFQAVNNGQNISINKVTDPSAEYDFEATTPLNDSDSLGQAFNFKVLTTNTLDALKQYRITIHKSLLYIHPEFLEAGQSPYITSKSNAGTSLYNLSNIGDKYLYQVSLLKDGNEIKFEHDADSDSDYFVSEPLSDRNSIYIKWILNVNGRLLSDVKFFGISISNWYNDEFNSIQNNKFTDTQINLKLNFNRQRTVGSIEYVPVQATYSPSQGNAWTIAGAMDAVDDWQFYLTNSMLNIAGNTFYGFYVEDVFGLNKEELNNEEKLNINVKIHTDCENLGFAVLDTFIHNSSNIVFANDIKFNYVQGSNNVILIGKIDPDKDIAIDETVNNNKDDYIVEFRQEGSDYKKDALIKRFIKIYQLLNTEDVNVYVPTPDFREDKLQDDYVAVTFANDPGDLIYNYYNYVYTKGVNGYTYSYVRVTKSYDPSKTYYERKSLLTVGSDVYILRTGSEYVVNVDYASNLSFGYDRLTVDAEVLGSLSNEYVKNIPGVNESGKNVLRTGINGSFNTVEKQKNFVKLTYNLFVKIYDYYKISNRVKEIEKELIVYIYESASSDMAVLSRTNIEKYDTSSVQNQEIQQIYGSEILTLKLNNNDDGIFDYVDIEWSVLGDGVSDDFTILSEDKCKFTFYNTTDKKHTGRLIATVKQFGKEFPVYCSYSVLKPVLGDSVELNTKVNVFKSGDSYINLKVAETKQFSATVKSSTGKPVSFDMVDYLICTPSGQKSNEIAIIDDAGMLQALKAGKAKLIIVAKESISSGWKTDATISNYLTHVASLPHVVVDIIVSDGTLYNPYLIANSGDFINIKNDFVGGVNSNYYSLVSNINLGGAKITFEGDFNGGISSYQQNANADTRFRISGIVLTSENPIIFERLTGVIENIDFILDFNFDYSSNLQGQTVINLGLVGVNDEDGKISNVTVVSSGNIDVNESSNTYIIGSLVAENCGTISLSDSKALAVDASITVTGNSSSSIILGGIVGQNSGSITGAIGTISSDTSVDDEVEYSIVYYGKEGVTAKVNLQLTESASGGALGGAVGFNNNGTISNILTEGKVLGVNSAKELKVDNVGGIIGKNVQTANLEANIIVKNNGVYNVLDSAGFIDPTFQITDSFSTALVKGNNNVGGVVGYDTNGSYQKVYYEMYISGEGIEGNDNVGGLIGYSNNSDLLYCYANNFGWGYVSKNEVTAYDVIGVTNVGGLIGYAKSTGMAPTGVGTYSSLVTTVVSCAVSVNIDEATNVAGIIGKLENFGAIYTAYYYGIINTEVGEYHGIVNVNDEIVDNTPYNNVYSIVNGSRFNMMVSGNPGFGKASDQNNGEYYVKYGDTNNNIINQVPTLIKFNNALQNWSDGEGKRAEVIDAETGNTDPTNYRAKALVLYYYGIIDTADELALEATYEFNKINMHNIVNDSGIIVVPETLKRFTLRSSDSAIVRVLEDGYILLLNEGQVTITITSLTNPSVSASFVVIVRSKVKTFTLHSSASLHSNFNVNNKTLNIIKGSSKIVYPNVKSSITYYKNFDYKPATHMGTKLTITCPTDSNIKISDYIEINGELQSSSTDSQSVYCVPFNTPIVISVKDYTLHKFKITASVYAIIEYIKDDGSIITIDDHDITTPNTPEFYISTKKGASGINTNKHQLVMMPADRATNLDVKISTDTAQETVYVDVEAIGDWEVDNPIWTSGMPEDEKKIQVVDMLTIDGLNLVDLNGEAEGNANPYNTDDIKTYCFNINSIAMLNNLQEFKFTLKLNENSHYIKQSLKLQITIYLKENGQRVVFDGQKVQAITFVNIEPQTISSMIARNYRVNNVVGGNISDSNISQGNIIRPGSTNILTVDVVPSIASFDYIEIFDTSTTEPILFRQVYKNTSGYYKTPANMDMWVEGGIKLRQLGSSGQEYAAVSQIFVEARLPVRSLTNVTHTISVVAYRGEQIIGESYLNIEAIAYPAITMSYVNPKGDITAQADTAGEVSNIVVDSSGKVVVMASDRADLACGVEATILIETFNIDQTSLNHQISIWNGTTPVSGYDDVIKLEYRYGKYILLFNNEVQDKWQDLIGKDVKVKFTASKTVNGATEYSEATITFTIRKFVVHGISMTHTNSRGNLYGDWGDPFNAEFYFDKTDISYYNTGYWNIQYTMKNTSNIPNQNSQYETLTKINELLVAFNSTWAGGKTIKLVKNKNSEETITSDVLKNGFTITNDNNKFTIGAQKPKTATDEDINDYKFVVEFDIGYTSASNNYPTLTPSDETKESVSSEFGFNVAEKTTPFDTYETINTAEEFIGMLDGKFYQLGNNIILENYTPINTPIGGFKGGEYSITIKSFNDAQLRNDYLSGDVNIGLFGTLPEDTIIQNLRVIYSNNINDGNVVNISMEQTYDDHPGNTVYFGGIAGVNQGVITNVRVSGSVSITASNIAAQLINCGGITALNSGVNDKVAAISNSTATLDINAIAIVGGIAVTNDGRISNTNFDGKITSTGTTSYVGDVLTAGFVVNNNNEATISLSYVKFSDITTANIRSVGNTAGFVLNNMGKISNCYISNANIFTQGTIGGFVYSSKGDISSSYSYIQTESSLFYNKFIYDLNAIGTLTGCYCVSESTNNIRVDGLKFIRPIEVGAVVWDGFIFAKNSAWAYDSTVGVWTMGENGPELVNAGFNAEYATSDDIYNIYSAETFEGWLGTELNESVEIIENMIIRIVRDIDFYAEGYIGNPTTINKTLMANIEGNDMEIRNFTIYKTSQDVDKQNSVGLFKEVQNASIQNLILKPSEVKATGSQAVGVLAGTMNSVKLYNITIDKNELLILGRNAVGGVAGIITGEIELIGINSNASVLAGYKHNTGGQYNMYLGKGVTGIDAVGNIEVVSYAGGIAGIIDGYNLQTSQWNINDYQEVKNINITGSLVLGGENVGSMFGLVGETTLLKNSHYIVPSDTRYQAIYVSGGLVGENRGVIQDCSITAEVEDGVRANTESLFNNFAKINGGIVGMNVGGLINKCIVDIEVCTSVKFSTVGGVIGRNIEGFVYNTAINGGKLSGYFVGGIAGSDYTYDIMTGALVGEATVTSETVVAFSTLQATGFVTYTGVESGVNHAFNNTIPFRNNSFSKTFMEKFIENKTYDYDSNYQGGDVKRVVSSSALYGLIVGYTVNKYGTTNTNLASEVCEYNNKMTVSLALNDSYNPTSKYNIGKIGGSVVTLTCIKQISDSPFINLFKNVKDDIKLLYLVAYEGLGYDAWSSASGYSKLLILAGKHGESV